MLNAQSKRVNSLNLRSSQIPVCRVCSRLWARQRSALLSELCFPAWPLHRLLSLPLHAPVLCVDWLCLLKHLSPDFSSRLLCSVLQECWQLYILGAICLRNRFLEVRATNPMIRKQSKWKNWNSVHLLLKKFTRKPVPPQRAVWGNGLLCLGVEYLFVILCFSFGLWSAVLHSESLNFTCIL